MAEIFIYAGVFIAACFGVRIFIAWSRRRKLFDIPNERSSHTRPTLRGGGLIIVVVCLCFYFFYTTFFAENFLWQYFVGAVLIAAISWLDDLRSVSVVWRILIHAVSACLIIQCLSEQPVVYGIAANSEPFKIAFYGAAFLWVVWLTNAYNFMDGIDGIAGVQAVIAGLGWLCAGKILGLETTAVFGGVLGFAALGFLIFNWSPAKVFMGDVGSAFLGYTFACLPFLALKENPRHWSSVFLTGAALLWLFLFDTLITFLRRLLRRENFWRAHREHVYQQMVSSGFAHSTVAALYGVLSVLNAALAAAALKDERLAFALFCAAVTESIGLLLFLRLAKKRQAKSGKRKVTF